MAVTFPYEYEGKGFFGHIYRPVAQVSFKSPTLGIWVKIWMIIDTGADFSVLPRYTAVDLNISLESDCVTDKTRGVGGEQTIYLVKKRVAAKIGGIKRSVPLAFFSTDEIPPLLGRLGFLETFEACFAKNHTTTFSE